MRVMYWIMLALIALGALKIFGKVAKWIFIVTLLTVGYIVFHFWM